MAEGGYEENIPLENRGEDREEDLDWDSHEEETSFTKDESFNIMRHYHEETFDDNQALEGEIIGSVKTYEIGAGDFIKKVYKDPKLNDISYGVNEKGYWVSLAKSNSVKYYVTHEGVQKNGKNKVPTMILKALGVKIVNVMGEINKNVDNLQVEEVKLENIIQERENKIRELENIIQEEKEGKKKVEKKLKLLNDRLLEYNEENEKLRDLIYHSTSPQERAELENELKKRIADGYEKLKEINILKGELDHFNDLQNELGENIKYREELNKENENLKVERKSLLKIIEERDELNIEHEELFERLSFKNEVKEIFKKYGYTMLGITSVIATVVATIVANLTNGVAAVAKGMANGFKALGKKIALMLPGMIGAIASFIFKTAGEVFGFLAENSWLLILLVVTFVVEQYTKKK